MRDEIIKMARQCGASCVEDETHFWTIEDVERFFHMAQAAEREACALFENELALSAAHFATVAEWKAYKKGVQKYAEYIRARGQQ